MAWLQSVSGVTRDKPTLRRQADEEPHDWYAPLPNIPECYKRNVPCEPCPTAVREAERVVRSRR
jgi:hypothetical protein